MTSAAGQPRKGVDGLAVRLGLAIAEMGSGRAPSVPPSTTSEAAELLRTENTVAEREHNRAPLRNRELPPFGELRGPRPAPRGW